MKFSFLFLVLLIFLLNCNKDKIQRSITLSLEEVESYGDESFSDSTQNDYLLGGEVFSNISSIEVSKNGDLHILDAGLKKVVIYNEKGELKRIIPGRMGRGPGEYRVPTSITVDKKGKIYVYDYQLLRATVYDSLGNIITTEHVPYRSKNIVVNNNIIWASILASKSHRVGYIDLNANKDTANSLNNFIIPITQSELDRTPHGVISWIDITPSGQLVVAKETPSIWYTLEKGGSYKERGKELLPKKIPKFVDGMWITPVQSKGISAIGKDRIATIWTESEDASPSSQLNAIWLDIFRINGEHLNTAKLPYQRITTFDFSKDGKYLYVAISDPFPQVVKLKIKPRIVD